MIQKALQRSALITTRNILIKISTGKYGFIKNPPGGIRVVGGKRIVTEITTGEKSGQESNEYKGSVFLIKFINMYGINPVTAADEHTFRILPLYSQKTHNQAQVREPLS